MKKKKRTSTKRYLSTIVSYSPYVEGMLIAIFGFSILVMFTGCMCMTAVVAVYISANPNRNEYQEYLKTPVNIATIDELCLGGAIPDSMQICNQPTRVMTYSQIHEMLKYYADEKYTYAQFGVLFGKYQKSRCYEEPSYYRCWYTFDDHSVSLIFKINTDILLGMG